jgi:hypothetical protein
MKHKVTINVIAGDREEKLLSARRARLPARLIKWIFGDFTYVYLMRPGEHIDSVDIKEVKEGSRT